MICSSVWLRGTRTIHGYWCKWHSSACPRRVLGGIVVRGRSEVLELLAGASPFVWIQGHFAFYFHHATLVHSSEWCCVGFDCLAIVFTLMASCV